MVTSISAVVGCTRRKPLIRLEVPRVPTAALIAMPDCYKIKLRSTGFSLVYRVRDDLLVLMTIAVGKRDKSAVYDAAKLRMTLSNEAIKGKAAITLTPKPGSRR